MTALLSFSSCLGPFGRATLGRERQSTLSPSSPRRFPKTWTVDEPGCARQVTSFDALTDEQLVDLIRTGFSRAFDILVERHQTKARHLALLVVHNENDANDIVQEAFLRVFCKLSGFSGESAFYTWFYRIVYNLAVDFLRRPYRKRVEFDRLETLLGAFTPIALPNKCTTRPDETVEGLELRQRIATALAELSVIHREVVILREVWGMSYEEMAQRLGCAKGTIMSRLHHARRRLQISLRAVYEAEYGVDGGKAAYETACK